MERSIDRHENRKSTIDQKINMWREAWTLIYQVIQQWSHCDLKQTHLIFEQWIPILNFIFKKPINLNKYNLNFYYWNKPHGPKEIFHLYFEENTSNDQVNIHVIFNMHEFYLIHKQFCTSMSKTNKLIINEARGTIDLNYSMEQEKSPAQYFQTMTMWQMLFIFVLHALAHWETYDKYEHAYYDTHMYVRDSPFYKLYFYGQVLYQK